MKTAVHFGAGNIGRGFIGAILSKGGYHVTFCDVVQDVIDRINKDGKFTVHVTDIDSDQFEISDIDALNSGSQEAVEAIVKADFVTTAVGVRIFRFVAPTVAKGLVARKAAGVEAPLNIIACENAVMATSQFKEQVVALLDLETAAWLDGHVGFINCAVDRIVPPVRCENPIDVAVESHCEWCVEKNAFVGAIPQIEHMTPVDNIPAYLERKLFTLNTGHAITAYLGQMKGYKTIDESIADPAIYKIVRGAMEESGAAIVKKYGFAPEVQAAYVEKTIKRFQNPYLKDDVTRVGREPLRKLSATDRIILPVTSAMGFGLPVDNLILGAGAALHFNNPDDPQSVEMHKTIAELGLGQAVAKFTGLEASDPLVNRIVEAYKAVEA